MDNKFTCTLVVLACVSLVSASASASPSPEGLASSKRQSDEIDFEGSVGGSRQQLQSQLASKQGNGPFSGSKDEDSEERLGLGAKVGPNGASLNALEQVSKNGGGSNSLGLGGAMGGLANVGSAGLDAIGYDNKLPFHHQQLPILPLILPPGHPKVDLSAVAKLVFNPFELARTISRHLNIPLDKFIDLVGKQVIFGVEAILYPVVASIKIFERVFIPDKCTLRWMCKLGNYLDFYKDVALRLSPNFVDVSVHVKALADGVAGRDCELAFAPCVPKLRQPFRALATGSANY